MSQATLRGMAEQLRDVKLNDTALSARMLAVAREALSTMMFAGGWIEKFERCHQLKACSIIGEAAPVRRAVVKEGRVSLQAVTSAFAKCDVFNMDETVF